MPALQSEASQMSFYPSWFRLMQCCVKSLKIWHQIVLPTTSLNHLWTQEKKNQWIILVSASSNALVRDFWFGGDDMLKLERLSMHFEGEEVDWGTQVVVSNSHYDQDHWRKEIENLALCFDSKGTLRTQTTLYGVKNPGDGTVLKLFFSIQWCLVFNDCLRHVMKFSSLIFYFIIRPISIELQKKV